MRRRGRVLTPGRAPQKGSALLRIALAGGQSKVVRGLLQAGADKNAPIATEVGERRGGYSGGTHWFCLLLRVASEAAACQCAADGS